MAKRYYMCDIIGDGSEFNPFRPAVADHGVAWVGSIPTGEDGRPVHSWALVLVATGNHAQLRGRADMDPLPDFALDGRADAIAAVERAAMKAAMRRRNLDANAIVDGRDGYRHVIRALGQVADPTFDENKFDIADQA